MDPELMTRAVIYGIASPMFIPLIELAKNLGLPARLAPLLAILLGLLTAVGAVAAVPLPPQPYMMTILTGLAMGLSAAGLYSGARSVLGMDRGSGARE